MWRIKHQRSTEKPGEIDKGEMRLSREAVGDGTEDPVLIATEALIRKESSPDYEEQLQDRGICRKMVEQENSSRIWYVERSRIRNVFIEMRMGDKGIEGGLGELVNMFGRNQLGCQDQRCSCGGDKGIRERRRAQESEKRKNREKSRHRYSRD